MSRTKYFLFIFAILILNSCARSSCHIIIDHIGISPTAVSVSVCGRFFSIDISHMPFNLEFPITCEGSGYIRASYGDGAKINCKIGYITPGIDQIFTFTINRPDMTCNPH
jgi:hypothetical protein